MFWVDFKQDAPEKTWQNLAVRQQQKVPEERKEVRVKFCLKKIIWDGISLTVRNKDSILKSLDDIIRLNGDNVMFIIDKHVLGRLFFYLFFALLWFL